MHRISVLQRPGLEETAREHGYEFHAGDGVPCWDETAYYRFSLRQIEEDLEKPAEEIAAIADNLTLPQNIERQLEELRRARNHDDPQP